MYFALALVPSLLFGSLGIVLMKLGGDPRQQTLGQIGGGVLVAGVLALFLGIDTDPKRLLFALVAGVLLGLGIQFQLKAFHRLGVSRVMPISTGIQLVGVSLLGVALFGEWIGSSALPVGLVGVFVTVLGVVLTSWTQPAPTSPRIPEEASAETEGGYVLAYAPSDLEAGPHHTRVSKEDWRRGLIYTITSAAFLTAFPVVSRLGDVDPLRALLPEMLGALLVGLVGALAVFSPRLDSEATVLSRYTLLALIPGTMWGLGVVLMQFSQIKVGVAVGFSLSQLGVVISTFGGIWLLGETRTKKEMRVISIGVVILVGGALLLGLAKALDVG